MADKMFYDDEYDGTDDSTVQHNPRHFPESRQTKLKFIFLLKILLVVNFRPHSTFF